MKKNGSTNFTVMAAFLTFIGLGLVLGLFGIAWPSIQTQFGLPLDGLNGLVVAQRLAYSLASLSIAHLMARFTTGRTFLAAIAFLAVCTFAIASSQSWLLIVVFATLSSFGGGLIDAGLNIYVATYHTARQMNWLHAIFGVGITISPLIMTYAITHALGWQIGYVIVGVLLLIPLGVCLLVRHQWRDDRVQIGQTTAVHRARFGETLRMPALWFSMAVFITYGAIEIGFGQWAYVVLTEARGIAPNVAGPWISMYWGSFTVGRILFGIVAHRFNSDHVLRLCTVLIVIGAALFWWNPAPMIGLISLIVLGFAQAPFFPLMITTMGPRVGAEHAENSIGLLMGVGGLGSAILRGAVGTIGENQSIEMMAFALFVIAVLLLVFHELVRAQKAAPQIPATVGE